METDQTRHDRARVQGEHDHERVVFVATHVDDLIWANTVATDKVFEELKKELILGTEEHTEATPTPQRDR